MNELVIRKGKREDMHDVHRLIRELAIYEKAENEHTNSVEELIEDGFGDSKLYDVIVAELDGKIVGFALFYTSYSTWKGRSLYLEDFIVTEKHRGKGIGKLLFDKVYTIAKERNVARFEWQVLNWNTPAIEFYQKYKVKFSDEWLNCKIEFK